MGKFTGIILVSDFDGTFTSHVPENYRKNIAEIERFKNDGGIFTFATGREYHSLSIVEPDFENIINGPVIMANGARLYDPDKKEYIVNYTLNAVLFSEFLDIIYEKFPEIGIRFSCEGGFVTPRLNQILKNDLGDILLKEIPIREINTKDLIDSGETVYKCVLVHDPEILECVREIAKDFNENNNNEFFFSKTYARGLEAIHKNASKNTLAKRLKEYLNVRDSREYKLFAIGDYDNDYEMIKFADLGAAPENALDHVKQAAKVHTVSCDDGAVADFIKIIEREYV